MESSAVENEQEPLEIQVKPPKCETGSQSTLNIRQSSVWSLNSCLNNCWTRSPRKRSQTSDISRSQVIWHRPVTNCIFDSHFKNTNRIENFNIEQLIAKGAFGCVLKVLPKTPAVDDESFALKSIRKSKVIRNNCVQQIKDEADIQKLCGHHPFIVQHIDSWQDRRHLYILSEYVANGELFSKICHFTIDLIRLYVAEIALAIDFLHNAGVIYRDAKPENILLTHNYHLKLTDFGLSKWLKIGERTRTMCGTYQYMAPEILRNEPYGHSVDWWALGVIACQMFIQKGPNTEEFIKASLSNEDKSITIIDFLPDEFQTIPNEGKDLIHRLLDIDPRIRLHSVMNLQRIALYKNFKIDLSCVQSISPNDIIQRDCISIKTSPEVPSIDFEF